MQKTLRAFSALTVLGGLSAFAYLASLPGDAQTGLLRISPFRAVSLAGILAVICASIFIFFRFNSTDRGESLVERIKGLRLRFFLSFILFAISLTVWNAFLFKDVLIKFTSEAVYVRLAPLMLLGALVCLQTGIVFMLPFLNNGESLRSLWKTVLLLLGGFALLAIFIALTDIGFTFDNVGLNWGSAGTPLSFAQVNLVLSITFLLSFPLYAVGSKIKDHHARWLLLFDIGIFLALWGMAVLLWSHQTISPSHFSPAPSAPNYEYYPYSDAAIFDRMSYHLSYGIGFSDRLVRRPLYVGLLAIFHAFGGTDYEGTVFVQILFLALIPSFIYLLTTKLSNRFAGFLAGGLIVLREANAIDLSGKIVASHAKLLMSDLTATLGVIIFVYACILLFKKQKHNSWLLLIIGASLGLLALVRAQSIVLLPLILLVVLLPQENKRLRFTSAVLILLGLVLVVTPWAWRNWNNTGVLALGDTGEKMLMARNYSLSPVEYPQQLPGETTVDFSSRLSRDILSFVLEHPGNVAFFMSNHFMHSFAENAVFIAPVYSTGTPVSLVTQNPFWDVWDGTLTTQNIFALLCNLFILAFGISLAQKDDKLAGWYPLLVFGIYQAGNALARTSGWRFALPVDWITLMYFCIALSYMPSKISSLFETSFPVLVNEIEVAHPNPVYPSVFLFLFFIGISLPLAERLIPQQNFDSFNDESKNVLIEKNILTSDQFTQFLEQKNAVFISGIALYPRYYKPDGDIYLADMPEDFTYLHFWLIFDGEIQVVLPREKPPEFFPHASIVSVLGCESGSYISARAVILNTTDGEQVVLQEPSQPLVCP
jgi:hypothetical protein